MLRTNQLQRADQMKTQVQQKQNLGSKIQIQLKSMLNEQNTLKRELQGTKDKLHNAEQRANSMHKELLNVTVRNYKVHDRGIYRFSGAAREHVSSSTTKVN